MHQTITWSRTPGTRPDPDDFMPSIKLCVRLLPPVINVIFFSLFSFFIFFVLLFSPTTLVRLDRPPLMRTSPHMYVHYTWGLLAQKLIIVIFRASSSSHMRSFPYVPFLRHYMHRYDLSFGQAGLPGSCAYALRSR